MGKRGKDDVSLRQILHAVLQLLCDCLGEGRVATKIEGQLGRIGQDWTEEPECRKWMGEEETEIQDKEG